METEYTLTQDGQSWEGGITIEDDVNNITYHTPVDLPQNSRKSIRVAFHNSDGFDFKASVHNLDGDGQESPIPVIRLDEERVCAYMSATRQIFGSGIESCGIIIQLRSTEELPETPMVWDNIDVLILNGVNTSSMSAKQKSSMLTWVASGGRLVVSGGIGINLTLQPLPEALRIGAPGPVHILTELPELSHDINEVATVQITLVADAVPLLSFDNKVIAGSQRVGKGTVDMIGWDVEQVDTNTWLQEIWINDKVPATSITLLGPRAITAEIGPSLYELEEIEDNPMPQIWVWFIFFVVYVVLIGPVTLYVVRRLSKPLYAWIMIPGWIVFALLLMSVLLSGSYGNTFPLFHDIAYISLNGEGLPARVVQGTALTAPQSRKIDWETPGFVRSLWGQHVVDTWKPTGNSYPLSVVNLPHVTHLTTQRPKGLISWAVEGVMENITLNADLALDSSQKSPAIQGSIYSAIDLHNISLVWMGSSSQTVHLLDSLTALKHTELSASMTPTPYYVDSYSSICGWRENGFREPLIKPVQPESPQFVDAPECFLTAEAMFVPFPTSDIAGGYKGESCIIKPTPCPQQTSGSIKSHLFVFASGQDGGWADTQMDIVSPYPPASTFIYSLPDYIDIRKITSMTINIELVDGSEQISSQEINLSIWDWQNEVWVKQSLDITSGISEQHLIIKGDEAVRYFNNKTRSVEIKLEVPENTYPQFKLPMSIEGIW